MRPAAATVSPDCDFWLQSRVLRTIYTSVRKILLRIQPARCDRIVIGKDTRLFVRHKLIASEFGHLPVILNTARQLLHHPRLELSRPREFHFPCSSTGVFAFTS